MLLSFQGKAEEEVSPSTSQSCQPVPTRRRKRQSDEGDQQSEPIPLGCKRMSEPEDENAVLGKVWATELSKMSKDQQIFAKKAINDIIFEGQMGTLHRYSVQIDVPPSRISKPTECFISSPKSDTSDQSNSQMQAPSSHSDN